MDSEENNVHGAINEVVRQMIEEVGAGRMSAEQLIDMLVKTVAEREEHTHEVTAAFRVGLIVQGYEEQALKLREVHMTLSQAGAMFAYMLDGAEPSDWLDNMHPALNRAFLQASVWVLRAGNADASIDDDSNHIDIRGHIAPWSDCDQEQEAIVEEFVKELDRELPTAPKPREGTWW